MKLNKLLLIAAMAVAGGFVASCNDDGYWDKAVSQGQAYSFKSKDFKHTYGPDDTVDSIAIVVSRADASRAEVLPINSYTEDDDIFVFPDSVFFAAGQHDASYIVAVSRDLDISEHISATLSFDSLAVGIPRVYPPQVKPVAPDPLEEDYTEADSLEWAAADSIYRAELTIYNDSVALHQSYVNKLKNYNLAINIDVLKDYSYRSLGKARYREEILCGIFGADPVEYEVEVQQSEQEPGIYRLVNAYGAIFPYNEDGDYDASSDYYVIIHAEDPAKVWIGRSRTGLDWGYGEFELWCMAGNYIEGAGYDLEDVDDQYFGTLENNIITFPSTANLYGIMGGSLYYRNSTGIFRIALPGAVIKDYSVSIAYAGRTYDADNNETVQTKVSLGANVDHAIVAIAAGDYDDVTKDYIANGDIPGIEVTASGDLDIPFASDQDGLHTIYIISFNEEGEVAEYAYTQFEHVLGEKVYNWQPLKLGTFTYTVLFTDYDEETEEESPFEQGDVVLYVDADDANHFKLGDADTPMFYSAEQFEFYQRGADLVFEDQSTGYVDTSSDNDGEIFVGEWSPIAAYYTERQPGQRDWGYTSQSFYDEDDDIFYFNTYYYGTQYYWGWVNHTTGFETYQVEEDAPEAVEAAIRRNAVKHARLRSVANAKKQLRKRGSQSVPFGLTTDNTGIRIIMTLPQLKK